MKALLSFGASLSLVAVSPAASLAATPVCLQVGMLVSPNAFHAYPAAPVWGGPWRRPDVRQGKAHLYRTMVRAEGVGPPDFAGHVKIVRLGCGAGLTCPSFVDLKTGKVAFAPALGSVEQPYDIADVPGIDDLRLVYHADSRLLVAIGARNEKDRLAGATLFEWRDGGLRLIRFIPNAALCRDGTGLESKR